MARRYFQVLHVCLFWYMLVVGLPLSIAQPLKGRLPGIQQELFSVVLNETRPYWVTLPEGYGADLAKSKQYPVIYVLDGEKYLPMVAGMLDFLSTGNRSQFSKCIIVGILNVDRTRDFTPTAAVSGRGGATLANSGGGSSFARFVVNELIPEVETRWKTGGERILIGHSFGGLETAHILLNHPESFSGYLLFDPSFWWDDFTLLQGDNLIKNEISPSTAKTVFIGYSGQQSNSPYIQGYDFSGRLKAEVPKEWHIQTEWYESESHGSVFVPALYDGLRAVLRSSE